VSRSFAMVIQQLPPHLRVSICVFYLVLRGLDTVEDDMEAFKGRNAEKLAHLHAFHTYLRNPSFNMDGVGEGDEKYLLQHFNYVNSIYLSLPAVDQDVIADICARMGAGMASYCGRDLREGTADLADYNLYCHYVAGLVGEGVCRTCGCCVPCRYRRAVLPRAVRCPALTRTPCIALWPRSRAVCMPQDCSWHTATRRPSCCRT